MRDALASTVAQATRITPVSVPRGVPRYPPREGRAITVWEGHATKHRQRVDVVSATTVERGAICPPVESVASSAKWSGYRRSVVALARNYLHLPTTWSPRHPLSPSVLFLFCIYGAVVRFRRSCENSDSAISSLRFNLIPKLVLYRVYRDVGGHLLGVQEQGYALSTS